jgi:catechol 2,3-dioxygenase-like lactoylglutathione lyase family enzyme
MSKLRDGLSGTVVTQVALVVRDIEKSIQAYAELLGMERPKWSLTDTEHKAHTRYRGRPSQARAKLAFFQLGQVSLELIEPVGGPSTWQEHLDTRGEGIHHIAFNVKNMDERIAAFEANGVPLVQKGDYTGGRYAYMDGTAKLGTVLELLESFG